MASLLSRNSRVREQVGEAIIVDIGLRHPSCKDSHQDHLYRIMMQMKKINAMKLHSRQEVKQMLGQVEQNSHVVDFLMTNLESDSEKIFSFSRLGLDQIASDWQDLKLDWELIRQDFVPWNGRTRFIRGSLSDYVRDSDIADMKRFFPNSDITKIANAGHWPHFDDPKAFFEILTTILTRNKLFI